MAVHQSWCCCAAAGGSHLMRNWLVSLQYVVQSHEMGQAFRELLEKMKGEGQHLFKYAVSTPQLIEIGLLCRIH